MDELIAALARLLGRPQPNTNTQPDPNAGVDPNRPWDSAVLRPPTQPRPAPVSQAAVPQVDPLGVQAPEAVVNALKKRNAFFAGIAGERPAQ